MQCVYTVYRIRISVNRQAGGRRRDRLEERCKTNQNMDAEREKKERKLQGLEKWTNKKFITGELRMRRKQQQFKESAGKEAAVLG